MLHVDIITPEETILSGDMESITLPTAEGEITVLGGHIPLISVLVPGTVIARKGKEEWVLAVSRGVIETDGKTLRVLADTADRAEGLEEAAVEAARKAAEKLVSDRRHDEEGLAEAAALLEREIAKLHTVRRHRARRR
jgi:F-type H+-transporting ATPase subunit epsilon